MARTRSQAAIASGRDNASGSDDNQVNSQSDDEESHVDAIQTYLHKARRHTKLLHKRLEKLRHENKKLRKQLKVKDKIPGESTSLRRSRFEVKQTDAKRIEESRNPAEQKAASKNSEEAREEAEDLEHAAEDDDSTYRITKLLRKFNDLMFVITLGERETCPVCFEMLQLNKCSSLICEHLFCNVCLPKISRGADETLHCPVCRQSCERDEVMLVHMSETSRWDALLEVAQASSAILRTEGETEEEEDEEGFIDDGDRSSDEADAEVGTGSAFQGSTEADKSQSPEFMDVSSRGALAPNFTRPYADSPTKEKRKRLEKLAEDRLNNKKSRRHE